ncbi:MAG TPA: outer membrane protein transport protein [Polyangiaceae bacterium]|nr:outer membrane protein transport protein [Polyangiaceae bacterium]
MKLLRLWPLPALVAAATLSGGTARASGFLTDQFGSDQGQPALANPYSVYFNPGAMAGMRGTDIVVDGVFAARSLDYNRSASALSYSGNTPSGDPVYTAANTGQAHVFNVLAAPFAGFVTDFGGSKLRLGVAAYIPFGGQVSWGKNATYANSAVDPGGYDGPQRWSSISTSTSSIYSTAALAYRLEKARIGIGASVSAIRTALVDVRARNADGSDDITNPNGSLKEGRSDLDVSGWQLGASAGVYWEATKDGALRFGASYTSQPGFGPMRLSGTFKLYPGGSASTAADLVQAYPDIIRFGGAWRVRPDTEVRLDGDWQRWSQFKYQCITNPGGACNADSNGVVSSSNTVKLDLPRDWNDTVKLRLGIAYWVAPETELSASFAWESAPSGKSHIDPLIYDSARLEPTIGVRHAFTRHLYASLSYTYIYVVPLTVNDSAYANYPALSRSPSTNGSYTSEIYIFDGALGYHF